MQGTYAVCFIQTSYTFKYSILCREPNTDISYTCLNIFYNIHPNNKSILFSSASLSWLSFSKSKSPTSLGHWQSCHLTQLLSLPSMPLVPARNLTLTPLAPVLPARLTSGSRLLLASLLLMAALCLWALVALTLTWPTHMTLLGQVRHSPPTLSPILRFVGNWGTRRVWWNA